MKSRHRMCRIFKNLSKRWCVAASCDFLRTPERCEREDISAARRSDFSAGARAVANSCASGAASAGGARLSEQIDAIADHGNGGACVRCVRPVRPSARTCPCRSRHSQFFNGLGGFAENGREYVIVLGEGLRTPEPWINVIANPNFGFLVSESGAGFTWSLNSHENQLTPWSNDPVIDTPGEAIYIRDEALRRSLDSHGSADSR